MKAVLIGYGNVGGALGALLSERNVSVDFVIRSGGVEDAAGNHLADTKDFARFVNADTAVFISVPSKGDGSEALSYYRASLEKGARVITCEKAVLAHHFELAREFRGRLAYSATVGGNSGILPALSAYAPADIREVRAVVNGTLNYIGDRLAAGATEEEAYGEVMEKGFAEPGSVSFGDAIENELHDVGYKAAILANHAGIYGKILTPDDITLSPYEKGARSAVILAPSGVEAGFRSFADESWFPKGVDNVLYVNGKKEAEGAGAGARATAERMYADFLALTALVR